jgi:hypothetical protein
MCTTGTGVTLPGQSGDTFIWLGQKIPGAIPDLPVGPSLGGSMTLAMWVRWHTLLPPRRGDGSWSSPTNHDPNEDSIVSLIDFGMHNDQDNVLSGPNTRHANRIYFHTYDWRVNYSTWSRVQGVYGAGFNSDYNGNSAYFPLAYNWLSEGDPPEFH